jgi:hypothetical protein
MTLMTLLDSDQLACYRGLKQWLKHCSSPKHKT